MEYKTYLYSDPTGGGDDAKLVLPVWANPPDTIRTRDDEGMALNFEYEGEDDE